MRRLIVALVCLAAGCGGPIVHGHLDDVPASARVTAIVALPVQLGFGRVSEQRRATRRTADAIIASTGGRAIAPDELAGTAPEQVTDGVRSLGEDPRRVLTFSVMAARTDRLESMSMPNAGARSRPVYRFADFTVRLDVRRADSAQVIGSIETYATAFASAPEIDAQGKPQGLQRAIEDAVEQALRSFAPHLVAVEPWPRLVEAPATDVGTSSGALGAVERLRKLQVLYPECPLPQLAALAAGDAKFLVLDPGRLAKLGVARGDLLSGVAGRNLGSRAAFARVLARGATPAMRVERKGSRFLVGQTLVAQTSAGVTKARTRAHR